VLQGGTDMVVLLVTALALAGAFVVVHGWFPGRHR
jgi:hypothetical protein